MPSHKRPLLGSDRHSRDVTFYPPRHDCYACNDTGIVANGDGLIRNYLPDYDTLPNGRPGGGTDCAVVCSCKAAYAELDQDGKIIRGGYREDSGALRTINTDQGPRYPGVDLPAEAISEIHKHRKDAWQETCDEINRTRQARNTGSDPSATPWFIAEVSDLIQDLKAQAIAKQQEQGRRLEHIGSILGNLNPEGETDA